MAALIRWDALYCVALKVSNVGRQLYSAAGIGSAAQLETEKSGLVE
jgi:hypothetical protein